jgi:predicted nucleic acid-binding protein
MTGRILVDTNVLVYAYDRTEPKRQSQARVVLDRIARVELGAISTQVLAEFFVTVTRRLAVPLTASEAYERVSNYLQSWPVMDMTAMAVLEAIRGVRDHQLNFWDAQIWAIARLNQIAVVFSEDFSNGQVIEGVRFIDPFAQGFSLGDWLG